MTLEEYDLLDDISVNIKNYKCFGESPQGFNEIKPINVLIGRNNSGKSSLLDLIEYIAKPKDLGKFSHNGKEPEITVTLPLKEEELKGVFPPNASGGEIGINHWDFGKKFIGSKITLLINGDKSINFVSLDPPLGLQDSIFQNQLAANKNIPFFHKIFKRIRAERDIKSEADGSFSVDEKGYGATNIIQQFINKAGLPRDLVKIELLAELNKIIEPDASFSDIVVQQIGNGEWEIYLKEERKGLIALSHSGSGLKTILLVLIFIFLVPFKENIPLEKYILALEEPENNLHPSVQRRLFLYLREIALTKHVYFFITSHSNIVIDLFSNDSNAQIYHMIHNGNEAISYPVETYIEKAGILDDLDIRASDLLQSNGVIWVEGPSDRLYMNKWIEIWSGGVLREGAHYQCVFYGGRLLSHLSADIPDTEQNDLIKILLTNRNAIILMDSDKREESNQINDTKKRIKIEIEKVGGFCWITEGKEVENYIPKSAITSYYDMEIDANVGAFEDFNNYLENIKSGEGGRFLTKKVRFAEEIRPHLNRENLCTMLDFQARMNDVINCIKKWNALN